MRQTSGGRTRSPRPSESGDARDLMRVKMELVAAQERREPDALGNALRAHPAFAGELAEFSAALVATSSYEAVTPTAETQAIAQRARARAIAALMPAITAPAVAAAPAENATALTLKALRRARGLTLSAVARQVGLGLDVLADLEAGAIRAATVPDRLVAALGALLQTTKERISGALDSQPVLRPAFGRDRASNQDLPIRDFNDAVRDSTSMDAAQKEQWLSR